MRNRAGSLLKVAMIVAVPGVCGLALSESSGAAASITATATLVGLASTLVVRGLYRR